MLTELYIENIAVIEKSNISFDKGLNVMTGETGAGKSVIIGAINAILGQRVSKDMIRTGADTAFVSACFNNISKSVIDKLYKLGFKLEEDGTLILQRELNLNGKNTCRINNRPATLAVLKDIGSQLINVYGQHESYFLLSPQTHIHYIDRMGNLMDSIDSYQRVYKEMKNVKARLDALKADDADKERRIDILNYQINEIESADLKVEEFDDLIERKNKYVNSEKISDSIKKAKYLIDGEDEFAGNLNMLSEVNSLLDGIEEYMPEIAKINEIIKEAFYNIEDCSFELGNLLEGIEYDPNELSMIEERLDLIYKLKRKYGDSIEEMLSYLEKSKMELEKITCSEEETLELEKSYTSLNNKVTALAEDLSNKRKETALVFAQKVQDELGFLDMPGVRIEVNVEDCELNPLGKDSLEFLISTNSGELTKPLSKIASGGELSRIMLAIKSVLSDKDGVDTLIFDEVDTGISGSAAQKVGLKLREVSKNRQVLCVTHLAQIAALGNQHYLIKKNVESGRTYTNINRISNEEREREIARIIGGLNITDTTIKNAREMLRLANK